MALPVSASTITAGGKIRCRGAYANEGRGYSGEGGQKSAAGVRWCAYAPRRVPARCRGAPPSPPAANGAATTE